MSDAEL